MKKSRYSEEQIIAVLKEHQAGIPVAELCRKHGISDATFYTWRKQYGGMEVSDARRLKGARGREPQAEEAAGGIDAGRRDAPRGARKKLLRPGSRRAFVNWAIEEKSYSQRRACGLIGLDPKTYRYASRRSDDAELRARLKALASERRRFGYRRLHILLKREGVALNHKKLFRLYREERLTVRRRGGRKRALGTRAPMTLPQGPNQRWSLDFVSDMLVDGRRFRVLVVVDDFTRECLALVVDTSLSGIRVARELDALVAVRGRPLMIVSDNGTELTSRAILQWQEDQTRRVALHRAGQADAERLRREPERPLPRRMPQRAPVPQPAGGPPAHRRMEDRLQRPPTAHEPRRPHPERVRNPVPEGPQREQSPVMNEGKLGATSIWATSYRCGCGPLGQTPLARNLRS